MAVRNNANSKDKRRNIVQNGIRSHKQSIYLSCSWEPKPSGASGSPGAERYFREGMLALPYNGLRKFNGASGYV